MTSLLAQQLRKVSLALGNAPDAGKPGAVASLLYSAAEAAEVDTQTVHENAVYGLEQLARVDVRFFAFRTSLFGTASLAMSRGRLTREELAAVDSSITAFLRLLAPHFLHPACFKTLEYLLRKYRVHEHNAEQLLAFALPFHGTKQFVRLAQACALENTAFLFLQPMQRSGASLPRASIVRRCQTDKAWLRLICEYGRLGGAAEQPNRFLVTLYAVTVCELLMAERQVEEETVRLLLPFMLHGLGGGGGGGSEGVSAEYRAATLMVLSQLASVATLQPDLLEVLLQQIFKHARAGEEAQALTAAVHLVATHPKCAALPKSVTKAIAKMPGAAAVLESLRARGARVQPLLRLLLPALGRRPTARGQAALLALVRTVALGDLAELVADAALEVPEDEADHKLRGELLRALDLRFPETVDAAVNAALAAARASGGEAAAQLADFVAAALAGSARAPLQGAAATVAAAVDAPSAQLRIEALGRLPELAASEAEAGFVRAALRRRLADEDPAVAEAALASPALPLLPPAELAAGLSGLLAAARASLEGQRGDKSGRRALRELVKKALRALAEQAAPETHDQAAAELLCWALAPPSGRKVAALACRLAAALDPALAGLPKGRQSTDGAGEDSKAEATAANRAAVGGLAGSLAEAQPSRVAALYSLAAPPGRHLLLLALLRGCASGSAAAAEAVLQIAQQQVPAPEQPEQQAASISEADFDGEGLPTDAYLERAVMRPGKLLPALLQRALLAALQSGVQLSAQKTQALFAALAARPWAAYSQHLEAAVRCMGADAPAFLADVCGAPHGSVPEAEQVAALRLLPAAASQAASLDLAHLLPRLLAALASPAAAVRCAALEALPPLAQGLGGKQGKAAAALLQSLASEAASIQADPTAVPALLRSLLSAAPASKRGAAETPASLLLAALPGLSGPAGLHAAGLLLEGLEAHPSRAALLQAACQLLRGLLQQLTEVSEQATGLALDFLALLTPEAAAEAAAGDAAPLQLLAELIAAPQQGQQAAPPPKLRAAAAAAVSPQLFAALLPGPHAQRCLMALLVAATRDASNQVRAAAHGTLEALPLSAGLLLPALAAQAPPVGRTPPAKRSRRAAASPATAAPAPELHGFSGRLLTTAALETLQWKHEIADGQQLLPALSACLASLLAQQPAVAAEPEEDSPEAAWVTSIGYLTQLALAALLHWAGAAPDSAELQEVDLAAVVACTAPEAGPQTRAAALQLLAKLAALRPAETLAQAGQIVAAVARAEAGSQAAAAAALGAVIPAWLGAGARPKALAASVLQALQGQPAHRALPLLAAVVAALPEEGGLQAVLEVVLERSCSLPAAPAEAAAGLGSQAALLELAGLLARQAPHAQQLAAFAGLLEAGLGAAQPEAGVPALAAELAVQELRQQRGAEPEGPVLQALQRLIEASLRRLQALSARAGGQPPSLQLTAATMAAAGLLEAAAAALPPAAQSAAALRLLAAEEDAVRRRALRLFESGLGRTHEPAEVAAAMAFCSQVGGLLGSDAPAATRQAALAALGSLAAAHGASDPQALLTALPAVIGQVAGDPWVVRAAAMAALSAIVAAAGPALLPALPRLVPALLSAAAAATAELPDEGSEAAMQHTASEAQQLESAAALAAVRSLADRLGPFLSPHLPDLLALLLQPALAQAGAAGDAAALAADARAGMCGSVPPRLLLPALAGHFDRAVQEGAGAVQALLRMAAQTLDGLKPAAAAAHADCLWGLATRALDLRLARPPRVPAVAQTEAAAVRLLCALTLKLSEARFKPLFLRLLDWAAALPAEGERGPERQMALFKAVNGLAEALRGVFVPYYRHLTDLAAAHLAGLGGCEAKAGKKKRRRTSAAAEESPEAALLRYEVVKALHKCFLYDRSGFLTEPLFHRLLPLLVRQLAADPPPELLAEVPPAEQPPAEAAAAGLDAAAEAAIAALVQLAVSGGSDALWKPLHHQVLMASRSESAHERRRALEAVSRLAERLGEEYVALVPEAMPFLAELLEDPELGVQNETRALLSRLEALTGEKLDEYLKV